MNPFRRKDKKPSACWKVTRTPRQGLKLPELLDEDGGWAGMELQRDKDVLATQPCSSLKLVLPPKSYLKTISICRLVSAASTQLYHTNWRSAYCCKCFKSGQSCHQRTQAFIHHAAWCSYCWVWGEKMVLPTRSVRILLNGKNIISKARSVVTTPQTSLQVLDNTSFTYSHSSECQWVYRRDY